MSTLYFLKNAARTLFMGTLFWNSVVPSLEGIVRRAATFQVIILRSFGVEGEDEESGRDFLRRGGDIGTQVDIVLGSRRDGVKVGRSVNRSAAIFYLFRSDQITKDHD